MPGTSISDEGLELIKNSEGLRLKAYKCPAGVWTIGYGHTGSDVYEGKVITRDEAEQILRKDLERFENAVAANVEVPINQNQRDALISWTYNLGEGNLKRSGMLKALNGRKYDQVPYEMEKWNKLSKNGVLVESDGLTRRRKEEADLFQKEITVAPDFSFQANSDYDTSRVQSPLSFRYSEPSHPFQWNIGENTRAGLHVSPRGGVGAQVQIQCCIS